MKGTVSALWLTAIMAMASSLDTSAQEKVELSLEGSVVNQYIWRGQYIGEAYLQPTLSVAWQGLSLTAEASTPLTNPQNAQELDLTASYTWRGLSFGIVDYWSTNTCGRYFYYPEHGSGHIFEAFAAYDFGLLSMSWQTYFAGNDFNDEGKRTYSSYAELKAPFRLADCQWQATMGIVPTASTNYETTSFAVTNIELKVSKDIQITDKFSLPIFASFIANPCSQKAYLVFGFTLTP